jgi:hypothetical protein
MYGDIVLFVLAKIWFLPVRLILSYVEPPVKKGVVNIPVSYRNMIRALKQWMQCMHCELFSGNLVLVDSKRVGPA